MLVGTWNIMRARIGYFSAYKSISQLIVWRGGSGAVGGDMDLVGEGFSLGRGFCCCLGEFVAGDRFVIQDVAFYEKYSFAEDSSLTQAPNVWRRSMRL